MVFIDRESNRLEGIIRHGSVRFPVTDVLSHRDVEEGLRYVVWDGLSSQAMVTLTAGIFLVAFALELGASNTVIGLLAAIPPLAELCQIPAIYLVEKVRNRRFLVVTNSFLARSFWVPIAAIPFFCPPSLAIPVLIAAMCCYGVFSSVSHCGWNSWMRDLIPQDRLGTFFSHRMRLATLLGIVLSLGAGLFIDVWKNSVPIDAISGYSLIFMLGYGAGILGVIFLAKTPEPRMDGIGKEHFIETLKGPFSDINFKKLLIFLGSWNFAVNLAAPFFTVYMLTLLGMNILWVTAFSVLSQLVSVAFYRFWGATTDRFSNKSVLRICGPLFMFCVLGWTFTTLPGIHALTIPLLVVLHILIGISTAGVILASGNISLKMAPKGQATAYLACAIVVNSVAAGIAPVIGGLCADFFAARELSLTLTWKDPVSTIAFETFDLQHWDFFFFFAFFIGLYSLYRLSFVEETGCIQEKQLVEALVSEIKREMRNLSTAGGLRNCLRFPLSRLR